MPMVMWRRHQAERAGRASTIQYHTPCPLRGRRTSIAAPTTADDRTTLRRPVSLCWRRMQVGADGEPAARAAAPQEWTRR